MKQMGPRCPNVTPTTKAKQIKQCDNANFVVGRNEDISSGSWALMSFSSFYGNKFTLLCQVSKTMIYDFSIIMLLNTNFFKKEKIVKC